MKAGFDNFFKTSLDKGDNPIKCQRLKRIIPDLEYTLILNQVAGFIEFSGYLHYSGIRIEDSRVGQESIKGTNSTAHSNRPSYKYLQDLPEQFSCYDGLCMLLHSLQSS
jgi:hypothetical protein